MLPISDNTILTALTSLSMFSEAVENAVKSKKLKPNVLEGLSGTGEKLSGNIVERAKYVATDLLNNKDFIEFSKKNNPNMLKYVKKFSSMTTAPTKKKKAPAKPSTSASSSKKSSATVNVKSNSNKKSK